MFKHIVSYWVYDTLDRARGLKVVSLTILNDEWYADREFLTVKLCLATHYPRHNPHVHRTHHGLRVQWTNLCWLLPLFLHPTRTYCALVGVL